MNLNYKCYNANGEQVMEEGKTMEKKRKLHLHTVITNKFYRSNSLDYNVNRALAIQ